MNKPLPTQQRLHELFYLVGGRLIRKADGNNQHTKRGNVAGFKIANRPRFQVAVDGKTYQLHRVIYVWQFGVDPGEMDVDHIDNDPSNNNIWNLQTLTPLANKEKRGNCVTYRASSGRFLVNVDVQGKATYLGSYATEAEALEVVREARAKR